jgi:diguanylate cyclase (GGDEF)-like protein/PAS domain S-box-containing protein
MSLRSRTLLTIGVLLFSLIIIVFIGSGQIALAGLSQLEQQSATSNVTKAVDEFNEDIGNLQAIALDYARSNAAYEYMQDADSSYIAQYYGANNLKNRALNTVIFIKPSGKIVYASRLDEDTQSLTVAPPDLEHQLQPGQPLFNLLDKPGGINGFVMLPGEPLLLTSQSIRRSDGSGQTNGYLVVGRYLSNTRLNNISHSLNVSLTVKTVDTMTSTVESRLLQNLLQTSQPLVTSFSTDKVSGYALIKDALGNPAFVVQVDTPHAITNLSQKVLDILMIILVVVAIGIDLIVLAYLERSILSRLTRLSRSVQQITRNRDTQARVEEGTADELGILARTINDMLKTIEQDTQLKEENASRFKMLVEQSPIGMYFVTDKQFAYVNQAAAQIFGFSPEDIDWNISPLDMIHPEDRAMVERESLAFENQTSETTSYRTRGICNDENVIHCAINERRVTWKGRPSTLGIVIDVSEHEIAQVNLRKRERILEAVSEIAQHFLKGSSWEENINEVLEILGIATQTKHVYIFKNRTLPDATRTMIPRYMWTKSTVNDVPAEPEWNHEVRYKADGFSEWEENLLQNKTVKANYTDLTQEQRNAIGIRDVSSFLAVPVYTAQDWWGFVGVADSRKVEAWSAAEEDALRLFASLLGSAIERKHAEEEKKGLYDSERQRRQLAEALVETGKVLNATLDFDGILDCLLAQVERIVPYDLGLIMLVQDGQARVARVHYHAPLPPQIGDAVGNLIFDIPHTANLRWMAETGQPLVIPDTSYYPEYMPAPDLELIGSWVQAPIMAGNIAIGFLFLGKHEPNVYSSEAAAYVTPFALQTAFALQNARLYADVSESLTRERRYNEIVRSISSSMELPIILRNIAYLGADLVKADAAGMALLNGNGDLVLSSYSTRPSLKFPDEMVTPGTGISWQVMKTNRAMLVTDYARHPNAINEWIARGLHAMIAVPIVAGDTQLGVLHFYTVSPEKQFTAPDIAVAEAIGQQAGMAIQRARLLDNARRRAQEAETLRQAGAAVTATLELHKTFERILEQLERVIPYDTASIQLLRQDHLEIVGGRGWSDLSKVIGARFACPGDTPNSTVVKERRPVLLSQTDMEDVASANRIHAWLGVPLIIHDQVIGMLTLDCYETNRFHPDHIRLASAFADHVAVAIENARLFEKVQQFAMIDELTGQYNRRSFFKLAEQALDYTRRNGHTFSILMIDIDRFKRVNDTYGHLAGDQVLRDVAQRCQKALRNEDMLARYGGEEFVALLRQVHLDEASGIAERLCQAVAVAPIVYRDLEIAVTVSVGVAYANDPNEKLEVLLRRADEAQYVAKNAGGNRVVPWDSDMTNRHYSHP